LGNNWWGVCTAILSFLNSRQLDEQINVTNVALIPKVKKPTLVLEFQPINLCNVIYKLISNVLANRLIEVLPHIITANQSAFIPGRLIFYNILAAYETLHSMQTKLWGKVGYMGFKLDMSKAYDRVEWDCLEVVMRRHGFSSK